MTRKEYKEYLRYELYEKSKVQLNFIQKLRIKYFQPNTNCVYMARRMWYLYSKGRFCRISAKMLYLRILRKYGCCIYPSAEVGKGFHITHPVGIVIGDCKIGTDFIIYQNCSIGTKKWKDEPPEIGNHCQLASNSLILGNIKICDYVIIGANSLVLKDINESGTYVGNPLRRLR